MEEYCKSIFVFSHLNTMSSSEIHFGTFPITVHCFFCLHMNYKIIDSTQKQIHETFYLKAGMA